MPKYEVKRDGKILRGAEEIGFADLTTGDIRAPKLAPVALTHIKSQIFDLMLARKSEPAPPLERPVPATEEFASYQPPPAPPMDPKLGDKTPVYMAWFEKCYPEDYARKYKGRRTHLTTKLNPHLEGGDVPDSHFGPEAEEVHWKK